MNNPLSDRIIVLGVDGMDNQLAYKFMKKGVMPNLQKLVDHGSAREDLRLLGGMPTVTPPMWTTLATGANPDTHGIIAFNNTHPTKIESQVYALDSRMCKAEPLWNVFAEAGKQVCVWHWPGSSWPPTYAGENFMVVDGVQPAGINHGTANCDKETVVIADAAFANTAFRPWVPDGHELPGAGCIITDVDEILEAGKDVAGRIADVDSSGNEFSAFIMSSEDEDISFLNKDKFDYIDTPIKPAHGWATAPEGAKEFSVYTSEGLVRRPALILRNEQGIYDRIAIYKSKKDTEPLFTVRNDEWTPNYVDEVVSEGKTLTASRSLRLLELAEDGSRLRLFFSSAYDMTCDGVWYPRSLYQEIVDKFGPIPPIVDCSGRMAEYVSKLMLPAWDAYCAWQADCLRYLLDERGVEVLFSHLHNVDLCGHQLWHLAKHYDGWGNDEEFYQDAIERLYVQTDEYLGKFMHYLDEGAAIVLVSDHGLICEQNRTDGMGSGGVNGIVMKELGYTVFKKDEDGNDLPELDHSKTRAVACRGYITLNMKDRYPDGIVDPAEKYDLEAQIITDLYSHKDPVTGKRTIAMALRAKDCAVLGLDVRDYNVDIVYFVEEGYNIVHMDSLPTQEGYFDSSVSPIFVAAGAGIKQGFVSPRVIREVDVAPTIAVIGGVRMPHECEGAPVYQILDTVY